MQRRLKRWVECGCLTTDDSELRLRKIALTLVALIIGPLAVIWGSVYLLLGFPISGAIPLTYSAVSLAGLAHLSHTKDVRLFQWSQLALVLVLPFLLMWSLGGFAASSLVMIWAIFSPIAAVMFLERQSALQWFLAYVGLIVASLLIDGHLAATMMPLPKWAQGTFYFLNVGGGSAGLYLLMSSLRKEERRGVAANLRIAATAFESMEGRFVTDAGHIILRVNQAFTKITGHAAEDAIGRTCAFLESDHHDADFYAALRAQVATQGAWEGEHWSRRRNGELYPQWHMVTAVKDESGQITHHVHTFIDMTSRKQAEEAIEKLAFYDSLTGLPNRRLLLDRLRDATLGSSLSGRHAALLFIDLDNFKTLNDTLGHDVGDNLLQQVARQLSECVGPSDTVARLGGDEFVVILRELSSDRSEAVDQVSTLCTQLLSTLNRNYQIAQYSHHCTGSLGVTLFNHHQGPLDELLKQADLAMYQAKSAGRNTMRFFTPLMATQVQTRAALEVDLRQALQDGQFHLHFQVQVNGLGQPEGAEVLLRWQHPQRGDVPPLEFIALAEHTGLILPIGQWVLETACRELAQWARRPESAHLMLSVNVSARQLHHPDFVASVLSTLERTGAEPKRLRLELTESLLVDDAEAAIRKMAELRAVGVTFALDDFGTGYSSLAYLKRLPLDELKLDRSFVRDILVDANDAAIARMVLLLGESLGLRVVAEGVEEAEQREFLARLGCHVCQGYLFSRPLPIHEFQQRFLQDRKPVDVIQVETTPLY
jgi:diguanylate cyclase (GGDEF)-like protein/PAS domain S-box-containing protein